MSMLERGGAGRKGGRGSEPRSVLTSDSPMWGLNSWTARSWPELKLDRNRLSHPDSPRHQIFTVYVPSNRASKYMKQKLIEGIDEFTVTVTHGTSHGMTQVTSTPPLSEVDRSSRQRTTKDRVEINNMVNHLDTIDVCRLLHPTTANHILLKLTCDIHQDRTRSGPWNRT